MKVSKSKERKIEDRQLPWKWVKKANMFCRTTFKNGKQFQEWFHENDKVRNNNTTM